MAAAPHGKLALGALAGLSLLVPAASAGAAAPSPAYTELIPASAHAVPGSAKMVAKSLGHRGTHLKVSAKAAPSGVARPSVDSLAAAVAAKGALDQALFLRVPCVKAGAFVAPATQGAKRDRCAKGAPVMGQRLQLDMTDAQINALRIPAWRKAIVRTFARYGGFVGAVGGKALRVELAPGTAAGRHFAANHRYTLKGVAWAKRLRVVDVPAATTGAGTEPAAASPSLAASAVTGARIPAAAAAATPAPAPVASADNFGLSWEDMPYGRSANRQPIPAGAATSPNASAINATLFATLKAAKPAMTVSGEVPTVNVAAPSDPVYRVSLSGNSTTLNLPIPTNLIMGTGADHPTLIRYPFATGGYPAYTELRIWQGTVNHGARTLTASRGGLHNYGPDGDATPLLGNGLGDGRSWTGLMLADQLRKTGGFHEALRFTTNTGWASGFKAPAIKTDQSGGGALVMGQRWQLDVTEAEILSRTVPGDNPQNLALLRAVMRAMRDYGLYLGDGGGPGFLLEMEDDATGHWSDVAGPALVQGGVNYGYGQIIRSTETAGGSGYRSTDGIPWSKLRPLAQSSW